MKWIHLKHEYYACVDDEDYEKVSQYLWRHSHRTGYARCDELEDITLHELLLGKAGEDKAIDHINRAPWDNRRSNIQIVPTWQNGVNRGLPVNPPFPTDSEMLEAKNQRYDLKYGERHKSIRSLKIRGQHKHQKNHHARKKVADDLGNIFESIADAASFYGIKSPAGISQCCLGRTKACYGRVWRYV